VISDRLDLLQHIGGQTLLKRLCLSFLIIVLAACGTTQGNHNDVENENNKEINDGKENNVNDNLDENDEEGIVRPDTSETDTLTSDGFDRVLFQEMYHDLLEEKISIDEMIDFVNDDAYLKSIPFQREEVDVSGIVDSIYKVDDDELEKESFDEFISEHFEEEQGVSLSLDDDPIRAISIPTDHIDVTQVMNFSPYIIDLNNDVAIVPDEKEREYFYQFFITFQSDQYENKDPSEYRAWEELTNIEQALYPTLGKSIELMYQLMALHLLDLEDEEALQLIIDEFEMLGDDMALFPDPQTMGDLTLHNSVMELKQLWLTIAVNDEGDGYLDHVQSIYDATINFAQDIHAYLLEDNDVWLDEEDYKEMYESY